MKYYLAVDIGASSGRHAVGSFADIENNNIKEVYRFANFVDVHNGHKIWNLERLFEEVLNGMSRAFQLYPKIESMAIDSWGADYALISNGHLLPPCYAYRDTRTNPAVSAVHEVIPFNELYNITGIQFQAFNTIYQLFTDMQTGRLNKADDFLMIPDYLNYKLTSIKKKEYTNATTGGLVNALQKEYDRSIIKKLGLPERMFSPLSMPGEIVGPILPEIAEKVGGNTVVRLCASHDTASAFEAVAHEADNSLILSSGTWSLLGIKSKTPILSNMAQKYNFTNEGGAGYFCFLKNITGLWLIGQLKKELGLGFAEMEAMAASSEYTQTFQVNDPVFLAPDNMVKTIASYIEEKGGNPPETNQDIINAVYHSLAIGYKQAVDEIESITGEHYKKMYIVGGGAKDRYLNKLTGIYTKKEIAALPIEAASIGNLKMQIK